MLRHVAMVVCLAFAASVARAEFPLAKDGTFVADVVTDPQLDLEVKADVLRVLQALAGAAPATPEAPAERPALIVGTKAYPPFEGRYSDVPDDGSFRIDVVGNRLCVVGGSAQGAAFGTYALLNDLGCRWFMPGALGEVIPTDPNLTWRGEARTESPDFYFRQIWWAYGGPPETQPEFAKWLRRNKVAFPGISHGHNLTNTVPPDTYLKDHPEYYALVGGTRQATQLCTTNPDVIRLSIERINAFFDERPDMLSCSLCPDDNTDFCECDNCKALDAGGWSDEFKKPVVTDRLMVYLNAVAQGIQERHPGKMVTTYAYLNYSTPPVREKVDPHVSVVFTTSVYCSAHGIGDPACESRQAMKRDLEGWIQAGPQVFVYEYDPVPYNAELPWPFFGAHLRSMPVYKAIGLRGFTFEAHNSWATLSPNFYVSARMMWDCDQSPEALLADFCDRFFAESAAPMHAYYAEMDRAMREYPRLVRWGAESYPLIFTPEVMDRCRTHLGEATGLATTSAVKSRLEMVAMGFDYLESYLTSFRAAQDRKPYEEYKAAYDKCLALVDRMYAASLDYILAPVARDYLNQNLGPLGIEFHGDRVGLLGDWMIIGPFDNADRKGHETPFAPEQALDFSKPCPGKGGQEVSWAEHHQPGGIIDMAKRFDSKDPAVAYAACCVSSPSERKAQIRVGSNDSIKVWLNGQLVHDNRASRNASLDQDVVPVTLPAGDSTLLLKITNEGRAWGYCCRITDEAGNLMSDLTYRLKQ